MFLKTVAVALLALCLLAPAAQAAGELYYLVGGSPGKIGEDAGPFGDATAAALGEFAGGSWSATEKTRWGFVGGVGGTYWFTDYLGASAEAAYASRGTKWSLSEPDSGYALEQLLSLNYIEVPLLVNFRPPVGGFLRPNLIAGPVFGFRVHSSLRIKAPPASGFGTLVQLDVDEDAKSSYVGGLVGAGASIRTSPRTALLLQVRYMTSFGNVVEDDAGYEFKPHGFSFSIGGSFDI